MGQNLVVLKFTTRVLIDFITSRNKAIRIRL